MTQKFITIANCKLAYLEKNSTAQNTIFFIHGNSVSSRSWKAQLSSERLQGYRLIAIDLPAHGDSGASADPGADYSIPGLGAIVAAAIKVLTADRPYILVALSLGTNIMAESLAFGLHPAGIVLAGSCLIGEKYTLDSFVYPDTNVAVVFTEQAPQNEVRLYASQVMSNSDASVVEEFVTDYYQVKLPFRSSLSGSIQEQKYNDQIALIHAVDKPALVIFGKDEQVINPDYLDDAPFKLWQNTVFKIPGASHLVQSDRPEEFNKLLADYAAATFI
ncbi:pimeloyl-ACP methyl ester carboxylesterase [Pedobacter sp. AK017]|uniref:alpha/beta fold hydrolase n=1 Tax=Pedobacter sp. AK017 TaxID=2723073 RepID=UPI0016181691|nr:alpha/beta hydrolase [Pedobacter sp. AK017]MBB5439415.1 pimeloyl-ACP methyl ester carboxylesterase [Pedobacter sp. AK017]